MDLLKNRFCPPGTRGMDRLLLALLYIVTLAYMLCGCNLGISSYDEGLIVYGSSQILDGRILYKDIWSNYGPGQYYLLALIFKVFGESLLVARVLSAFVNSWIAFCGFLLARKLVPHKYALFSWFLVLLLLADLPPYGRAVSTSLLFCLLSCLSLARAFETGRRRWLLIAGLCIGVTTIFRHDFGFYTFVPVFLAAFFFSSSNIRAANDGQRGKLRSQLQVYLLLSVGIAVVAGPAVIFLLLNVESRVLFEDLILFPATVYSKVRAMPWPPPCPNPFKLLHGDITIGKFFRKTLQVFPLYLPIVFVVTATDLCLRLWRRLNFTVGHFVQLLLVLLGLTFFNYSRVGFSMSSAMPQITFAVVLLPSALYSFGHSNPSKYRTIFYSFTIFMVLMASFSFGRFFVQSTGRKLGISKSSRTLAALSIERGRGIKLRQEEAEPLQQALYYVKNITAPDERIFVGTTRHDRLWSSDPMFYFLADRHNATRYNDLCPGLATTEPVQKEIIKDLLTNRVRCIVLTSAFEDVERTNESNKSSGILLLDNFIKEHYSNVANFGVYSIMRLNSAGQEDLFE